MADTEAKPQPPDLTRRTLTPFGYAVCVAVPILIAAIGFTLLHFHYNKEQLVRGDRLSILTSDWKSGDPAGDATVSGKLTLGSDGCLRLTADGQVRDCLFARTESDLRTALRAGADDDELADRWRRAMAGKLPGHGINDPSFLQPDRPMSAIGG